MSQFNNNKKKQPNFFMVIILFIEMTWKAMSTKHTSSRRNPLFVKFHNGKSLHVTRKEQVLSSLLWIGIACVNLLVSVFGPACHGFIYGSATIHKYLYQGTEAHDMMAGIIYDVNTGLKMYLIENTWMGGLLDTLANYNFLQLSIIVVSTILFFASFVFVVWTFKQFKLHTRHQMYL